MDPPLCICVCVCVCVLAPFGPVEGREAVRNHLKFLQSVDTHSRAALQKNNNLWGQNERGGMFRSAPHGKMMLKKKPTSVEYIDPVNQVLDVRKEGAGDGDGTLTGRPMSRENG
mmetsp:Transcript_18552/g.37532  ORF Transcript_18552/g.37532 Transcript_18552/m.37532 type:complete len:114 (+) Transcript_18552:105-446(+)